MEIPLTNSPLMAIIDDSDARLVAGKRFYIQKNVHVFTTTRPYIALHHLIGGRPPKGLQTDHKDTDPLNNRRNNLRFATKRQNQGNVHKKRISKSPFKGVAIRGTGEFVAMIRNDKSKRIYLGTFDTAEKAAKAYDIAARKYFGEFARLNLPYA